MMARYKDAVESFLEELVVRRELADNFCHRKPLPHIDNMAAAIASSSMLALIAGRPHRHTPCVSGCTLCLLCPLPDTPDAYDNINCAATWARDSLDKHRVDKREHIYTR